jgi:uncharacterized membrane protein YgdD (TMEM256/DUF423 family)
MDRTFLLIGAWSGFIAVALGAFGAHGLRNRMSAEMLAVFETGVRYQMYHTLAILIVGLTAARLVFSGSLYVLAITGTTAFGAITPLGGVALLAGWACLILAAVALG